LRLRFSSSFAPELSNVERRRITVMSSLLRFSTLRGCRKPASRIASRLALFRRCGRIGLVVVMVGCALTCRADEFDVLREKWAEMLTGGSHLDLADPSVASAISKLDSSASSYWSTMDKSPTRTFLWHDLASATDTGDITANYERLKSMALAYATPGSSLKGNASLKDDIVRGLDWVYASRYNETTPMHDEWWHLEIGAPAELVDITALMFGELSPAQVASYMRAVEKFTPSAAMPTPDGTKWSFTAANRMWKIHIVTIRGIIVKDGAKLLSARDAFSDLFLYVRRGDGFYADGSFIQHRGHPYTAGYGASLFGRLAPVLALLNGPNKESASGSSWKVTDPNIANLYRMVFVALEPLIYRGGVMAMVQGREISRRSASEHAIGHGIMQNILLISQFAPEADSVRMRSMLKYWAEADTALSFVDTVPLGLKDDVRQLLADSSVVPRGELVGNFVYAGMDRVVHLAPGFGLGISMSSSRIYTYESIHGENVNGWHTGEGMLYLYNSDLTQFDDGFWPTIDPRRLPGTTVDVDQIRAPASGQSEAPATAWVGGATLGAYGAAGMQLRGWGSTLKAKKSWFMFDSEIVCLGSDISSSDSRPIETVVENRLLHGGGDSTFTVDGKRKAGVLGWSEAMQGVTWAHLAGQTPDGDIGYYFPGSASLHALREARSGVWNETTTTVTRNYLTLWLTQGTNPAGATYSYVLLPGYSASQVSDYAKHPRVEVLENSDHIQAVRADSLGLTGANFWTDGRSTIGMITVDKKASVLVQTRGTLLDVAVSDPTQVGKGAITVELASPALKLVSADAGVTVTQLSPTIRISVGVEDAAGKTFHASFVDSPPIVAASDDKAAPLRDAGAGRPITPALKHDGVVWSAAFSPDGSSVVTASDDKTARVWDARTGRPLTPVLRHDGIVRSAVFSPDGTRVVTASDDKTAQVWDARTGRPLTPALKHDGVVWSATFSPDGSRIITASWDEMVRVWDARTGQLLFPPLKHENLINSAAFSPDGSLIVTASDVTARVWDAKTGQPLALLLKHESLVNSAAFSPDGSRIVTASCDDTARVWDAKTGQPVTPPLKHEAWVTSAAFSPDGLRIVTASLDGTARVWDARTGQALTPPLKHDEGVHSAAFSPDGLRIVTASDDKTARVWDSRTGKLLAPPLKHDGPILSASFSPDGSRIVTASWDGTARVWDAGTGPLPAPH
jgi:hyaluronate lyase